MGIVGGCLLICVPTLISDFLFQNKELAIRDKQFKETFSCYLSGFRIKANILNLMFYPVYMFRRLTFAFTIVILADIPELQLAFISLETAVYLCYLVFLRPLKNKYSHYSSICSELTFFFFTLLLSCFVELRPDKLTSVMGWIMIVMVILSMVCSWGLVIVQQLETWRAKKQKKQSGTGKTTANHKASIERIRKSPKSKTNVEKLKEVAVNNTELKGLSKK
eukprot:TRINITY_DN12818_c0_g1_i16.p2 TRINITY_DN12818_c0_g1~~TRINITY_DN12818_c0_g1_i16.p2  ORF type:complete len:221 (-),score=55.76 TRINITY_DN12818_c0_g1_i16:129-791(-)